MIRNPSEATILIVDDSPEMIAVLGEILPKNIKRQVALNGEKALSLLGRSSQMPDLILLDVMMPGIDGYEVCKTIKRNSRLREIPIIFISALNDTFDKVRAFELGAVDYITKPFEKNEVLARIGTHLEIARSKREIQGLYSETIQGIIGAMSDMLAIANPEVANISNGMKLYSEKIMGKLGITSTWDLKLACALSGLGMLTENIKKKDISYGWDYKSVDVSTSTDSDAEISKAYQSLAISNSIIQKIPKFEKVTGIITESMIPLEDQYKNLPANNMHPDSLKGQILRVLIYYIYKLNHHQNYPKIINEMRESEQEVYCLEILDILEKVQSDLAKGKVASVVTEMLAPSMILAEDLYTPDGRLILKSGYELSQQTITLIKNFDSLSGVEIKVIQQETVISQ